MIEIKKGEGLIEYIRRHEKMEKELSEISGIPAPLIGNPENLRHKGVTGLKIFGGISFVEEFKKCINKI